MTYPTLDAFLSGAITMACLATGLFFLKYWSRTRDRFFVFFACAFWILALERIIICFYREDVLSPSVYLLRMMAFLVIIFAIVDKNRNGTAV